MDLSIIPQILQHAPRLILPNLGAFLVKDAEQGLQPDRVSFSPFLRYNDGLLEQKVKEILALPADQARDYAQRIVETIRQALQQDGACPIPQLGTLRQQTPDMILFEPLGATPIESNPPAKPIEEDVIRVAPADTPTSYHPESQPPDDSALTVDLLDVKEATQQAEPVGESLAAQQTPAQAPQAAPKPRTYNDGDHEDTTDDDTQPRRKASWFSTVLVIILVLFGALTADYLWIHILTPPLLSLIDRTDAEATTETMDATTAELDNDANEPEAHEPMPSHAPSEPQSELEREYLSRTAAATAPSQPAQRQEPRPSPEPSATRTSSQPYPQRAIDSDIEKPYPKSSDVNVYHIILGSFRNEEYAHSFLDNLSGRGFAPEIIPQSTGMYAVSVASFSSRPQAGDALTTIRTRYPQAWILVQ